MLESLPPFEALVDCGRILTPFGGYVMERGFDEAKSQRNWLERLGEKIPGFRGFQDRELRREVDKLQREYLASEITRLKSDLRKLVEEQWKDVCAPDEWCDACTDMREFLFKIEKLMDGGK